MPAIPVDPQWDKSAYLQVADDLHRRIDTGEIESMLPGERRMAEEYETSIGTVRHALEVLRERSEIKTIKARGSYVKSTMHSPRGETAPS
jgi:GntR family transcriptional regulator